MAARDPRVDQYIAQAAEFARPILTHLRHLVHQAAPDIEEALKWNSPFFVQCGIVCHMAAFKSHCAFGFWKASLLFPPAAKPKEAMGHFGRITQLSDLPSDDEIMDLIR